jgi:hypothetical protein
MNITRTLAILFFFSVSAIAGTPDIPTHEECAMIGILKSEGPRLSISPDGSGTLALGSLLPHARFKRGTFDFAKVHEELRSQVIERIKNAEQPYVFVTFVRKNEAASRSYYIYNDKLVSRLFSQAEQNSVGIKRK